MDEKERLEKGQVQAKAIVEILGAPKEHIEKTLRNYVEKLKKDKNKDYEIISQHFEEAKKQKELFSAFVELNIWFNDMESLLYFCFDSMPSSIEIIKPERLAIESNVLTGFLNDLQAKIHQNDMIVKTLKAKQDMMDKNSDHLLKRFVNVTLKDGEKTLEEISNIMGIPEKQLKPFIDKLTKENFVKEKEGKYGRGS